MAYCIILRANPYSQGTKSNINFEGYGNQNARSLGATIQLLRTHMH